MVKWNENFHEGLLQNQNPLATHNPFKQGLSLIGIEREWNPWQFLQNTLLSALICSQIS